MYFLCSLSLTEQLPSKKTLGRCDQPGLAWPNMNPNSVKPMFITFHLSYHILMYNTTSKTYENVIDSNNSQ